MSNIMDKVIIDAPTKELEDAMRHKLEHHFDEQEALKEALERDEEHEEAWVCIDKLSKKEKLALLRKVKNV